MLNLGTITVTADSDVTLSVVKADGKAVDDSFAEQPFTRFGSLEDYTLKTPEEMTPEETPEET